ncbi:hypothetical protein E2320_016306, partial [Naja naja]
VILESDPQQVLHRVAVRVSEPCLTFSFLTACPKSRSPSDLFFRKVNEIFCMPPNRVPSSYFRGRMSLSQNRQSHRCCSQQRNRSSGPFCDEEPCGICSIGLLSSTEPLVCLSCTDQIIT